MRAYQSANVPGPHVGKVASSGIIANAIKKAMRPVLIIGSDIAHLDWMRSLAEEMDIPIVATAHIAGAMRENGFNPDRVLGAVEIANLLESPKWTGIRGEGQHDLAIFAGVKYYLEAQMLSALKNFAPHLTTIALSPGYQPNADLSIPNLNEGEFDELLAKVTDALSIESFRYSQTVNLIKCTECGDCVLACEKEHGIARIRLSEKQIPVLCLHCLPDKAKCAAACEVDAIRDESGILVVDSELCTGCGACEEACPAGHIYVGSDGVAHKCTLCVDSERIIPACVTACRDGAMMYGVTEKRKAKKTAKKG